MATGAVSEEAAAWHEQGLQHLRQGRLAAAAQALQRAAQLAPQQPTTLRAWAAALARLGQPAAALQRCDRALQLLTGQHGLEPGVERAPGPSCPSDLLPPWHPSGAFGHSGPDVQQHAAALCPEVAPEARAEVAATLSDRAAVLSTLGRLDEAVLSAQRACQLSPGSAAARNNLAAVRLRLHQAGPALAAAEQALALAPGDAAAAANRVRALHLLGRGEEALQQAQALTRAQPRAALAWNLRLGLCTLAGRWAEAAEVGEQLLRLAPATPFAAGRWLHARGKLCRWDGWAQHLAQHARAVAAGRPVALPQGLLLMLDDGALQRQAAQAWLLHEVPTWPAPVAADSSGEPGAPPAHRVHNRRPGPWRVGWLSADFRAHATARLLVGTFEALLDPGFEHHALSITPLCPADPVQQRLRAALPHWHELHGLDDQRAAQAIAALELDVLVDLGGISRGARPGVLARRPAPWQVAYLGFLSSSSMPAPRAVVDAVLADDTLVPAAHETHFHERVLRLPSGMWPREAMLSSAQAQALQGVLDQALDQTSRPAPNTAPDPSVGHDALATGAAHSAHSANSAHTPHATRTALRQAHGLPPTGFVFCNFSDATKLNPPLFDVWMRLLLAVPGSLLWLRRGAHEMVDRLRAEAQGRGVDAQRLVWADPQPWFQHVMRHPAADLFLDSWPCNGHTTVADALLAGLPVLTLQAKAMAGRVAASQLHTLGLQELVCTDVAAYEALAVDLAAQPARLLGLRRRLRAALQVHTGPLAAGRHADELLACLLGEPAPRPPCATA